MLTDGYLMRNVPAEIDFYLNNLLVSDNEYFSIAKADSEITLAVKSIIERAGESEIRPDQRLGCLSVLGAVGVINGSGDFQIRGGH